MATTLATVLAQNGAARTVGLVIALLAVAGFVTYIVINVRQGRAEVGSEIEIAPNRKPYYSDEELEGKRLNWALLSSFVLLGILAVGLPLYWLGEPARMEGAVETFDNTWVHRGSQLFATTGEGGYNCAGCHGAEGVGGVAPYTITDEDGEFVATVNWKGPALNTVLLRHSEEEVLDVLIYGRPFSPMPGWGEAGGGPLTSQQLDELIAYMWSFQLTPEEARGQVEEALRGQLGLADGAAIDYDDPETGEALFNLGRDDGFAGGAYSCARCHTRGWSITDPIEPEDADVAEFVDWPDGSGAFGPSLRYPIIPRQFGDVDELVEFIANGSEFGLQYGRNGMGSGRMPGFQHNPNEQDVRPPGFESEGEDDGMMTEDMIRSIAAYVQTLAEDGAEGEGGEATGPDQAANGNGNGAGNGGQG